MLINAIQWEQAFQRILIAENALDLNQKAHQALEAVPLKGIAQR